MKPDWKGIYPALTTKFTSNLGIAVKNSDIVFICVGTPITKKKKSADLRFVFNVASEISKHINKFKRVRIEI